MKTLICIDRDGTILYDDKYHLGHTNDWKKKIKILPHVVEGIKMLRKIPDVGIYIITNQPGVATKDFKLLTEKRARQVCNEVLARLARRGARLDGYFICPHASPEYTKKRSDRSFDKKLVCSCSCIKPSLGMVFDALSAHGGLPNKANIFVIGDRSSDVETALNIKGTGVFIPFENEIGEETIVRKKYGKRKDVYFAKDLVDAASHIRRGMKS